MPTDFDAILTDSLRAHAGDIADPAPIMHAAVARGKRIRRRRRMLAAGGVAAATIGVVAALAIAPGRPNTTPADRPSPSSSTDSQDPYAGYEDLQKVIPPLTNLALLPAAPGVPGASSRPDLVGTDPRALHFSVDALAGSARRAQWISAPGVETAVILGRDGQLQLAVAQSEAATALESFDPPDPATLSAPTSVTIGGRSGTARSTAPSPTNGMVAWSLTWQPVDGLWAKADLHAKTLDGALKIVQTVRFDEARRCAVPFRLEALPTGTSVQRCRVELGAHWPPGVHTSSSLTIGDAQRKFQVTASDAGKMPDVKGALKAGPYSVYRQPNHKWDMTAQGLFIESGSVTKARFTEPEALRVLAGCRPVGDPNNPSTW
jgi:hypothetical protein